MKGFDVVAVVVTYNRKALLHACLGALTNQIRQPDLVLVIDNASSDGTREMLETEGWLQHSLIRYFALSANLGGAGGFEHGIQNALGIGASRMWLMDDDASPEPEALQNLLAVATEPGCIYGSLAVMNEELCWPVQLLDSSRSRVINIEQLPPVGEVEFLPFLGFLIDQTVVEKIGLPDAGYFIAADDLEYSLRARKAGFNTLLVRNSRIRHPKPVTYPMHLPGLTLNCLRLAPWKRYYDTRNRILVARSYYGIRLFTQTLPGLLVRMIGTLLHEPHRSAQLKAFAAGVCDGLLGRKGRRHEWWGLKT